MDYRIYDPVIFPVFILAESGAILHANPTGLLWLSKTMNDMLTGNITNYVSFQGADINTLVEDRAPYERIPHANVTFRVIAAAREGACEITAMKLSGDSTHYNFALFVFDKAFAQEPSALLSIPSTVATAAAQTDFELTSPDGLRIQTAAAPAPALNLPNEKFARLNSKVNIVCPELKVSTIGHAVSIAEDWVEALVKNSELKPGYKCSLELSDLGGLSGLMSKANILYVSEQGSDHLVRFQFEGMSAINKKNLDAFLEKNGAK